MSTSPVSIERISGYKSEGFQPPQIRTISISRSETRGRGAAGEGPVISVIVGAGWSWDWRSGCLSVLSVNVRKGARPPPVVTSDCITSSSYARHMTGLRHDLNSSVISPPPNLILNPLSTAPAGCPGNYHVQLLLYFSPPSPFLTVIPHHSLPLFITPCPRRSSSLPAPRLSAVFITPCPSAVSLTPYPCPLPQDCLKAAYCSSDSGE